MASLLVFSEKLWGTKGSKDFQAFQQRANKVFPGDDGFELVSSSKSKHKAGTVRLGHFPRTTFLKRKVKTDQNGLVFKLKKPINLVETLSVPLNLDGSPDCLEFPWTVKMKVTRYADGKMGGWYKELHAHEAVLNSNRSTLFLDYQYYADFDNRTKLPTAIKGGVCLVRAAQKGLPTPARSENRTVIDFGYKLPVGEPVELTFIGQQRYTELYVNGKLVKQVPLQAVCPLKELGDSVADQGFYGKIHSLEIYNKDLSPKAKLIGAWTPSNIASTFTYLTIPIEVSAKGVLNVKFDYSKGNHGLDIAKVELLQNGSVISTDQHVAFTGGSSKNNLFTLHLKSVHASAKYSIRATMKGKGGTNSYGEITLISKTQNKP